MPAPQIKGIRQLTIHKAPPITGIRTIAIWFMVNSTAILGAISLGSAVFEKKH